MMQFHTLYLSSHLNILDIKIDSLSNWHFSTKQKTL